MTDATVRVAVEGSTHSVVDIDENGIEDGARLHLQVENRL